MPDSSGTEKPPCEKIAPGQALDILTVALEALRNAIVLPTESRGAATRLRPAAPKRIDVRCVRHGRNHPDCRCGLPPLEMVAGGAKTAAKSSAHLKLVQIDDILLDQKEKIA